MAGRSVPRPRAHRWVMAVGDGWSVQDEHGVTAGERFETSAAAKDAAVAMVQEIGSGVVYVQRGESTEYDSHRVDADRAP